MRTGETRERTCSYVVVLENAAAPPDELRELANYLSALGSAGADVVILDPSPRPQFECNARVLRWVGRHLPVRAEYRSPSGSIDLLRAALDTSRCEKVIVAAEDVRYAPGSIGRVCALLDVHEVVEPQDYLDPLPWWGGIEAGRILIHRGIEPQPDHGATFGFRRGAIRSLRHLGTGVVVHEDPVRKLTTVGAEVHPAADVFVRRRPGGLREWLTSRARRAADEFDLPVKSAFFFSLAPLLVLFAVLGGLRLAGGYAGVIAFTSVALALRGRAGARPFFPWRAVLFAPLWVLERSVSVYWALLRKLRGADEPVRVPLPERRTGTQVASGE